MTLVRKSITLTQQQSAWLKSQVEQGHYGNESEILRDLIRQQQERTQGLEQLRVALVQGEQSGISSRSARQIIEEAKQRLGDDDIRPK